MSQIQFNEEVASIRRMGPLDDRDVALLWAADRLAAIKSVADDQDEDEGLWFKHEYITEWALQEALRRLHSVIEGDTQ